MNFRHLNYITSEKCTQEKLTIPEFRVLPVFLRTTWTVKFFPFKGVVQKVLSPTACWRFRGLRPELVGKQVTPYARSARVQEPRGTARRSAHPWGREQRGHEQARVITSVLVITTSTNLLNNYLIG